MTDDLREARAGAARRRVLCVALAAAAAVVAILVFRPREGSGPGPRTPVGNAVAGLDLGAGPSGGGAGIPVLLLDRGIARVELVFAPPENPGAAYEAEIRDPRGATVFRSPRAALILEPDGSSRLRIEATVLSLSGDYRLRLREFSAGGEVRDYSYPFRVSVQE